MSSRLATNITNRAGSSIQYLEYTYVNIFTANTVTQKRTTEKLFAGVLPPRMVLTRSLAAECEEERSAQEKRSSP